ncbi:hypothetical protein [Ruminococcus sp.]|uniref:hypothetical protein n=1 Tax=Ruminococcus sp. TaxID=41978 RepID=UPI0025D3B7FA|nr:hypothetical protein [Ruminococcus sp.]MBQ8966997.1 hypothetical protein [Ruminococcus sp.]
MAVDKSFRADLAYSYELNYVFGVVCQAGQQCGFSIDRADNFYYIINMSNSMNLWTWGESITVTMGLLPDGRTGVTIVSNSNMGTEFRARKQNQENVQKLVNMINNYLR